MDNIRRSKNFAIIFPEYKHNIKTYFWYCEMAREKIYKAWFNIQPRQWTDPCLVRINYVEPENVFAWTSLKAKKLEISIFNVADDSIMRQSLNHEITHAIMLSKFGNDGLPLWLDEGIALLSEDNPEKRLNNLCGDCTFTELFNETYYPREWRPFYGQSLSVVRYLLTLQGRENLLAFGLFGAKAGDYHEASLLYYKMELDELNNGWRKYKSS